MYSFSIYLSIYQSSSNLLIALLIHLILEYMASWCFYNELLRSQK